MENRDDQIVEINHLLINYIDNPDLSFKLSLGKGVSEVLISDFDGVDIDVHDGSCDVVDIGQTKIAELNHYHIKIIDSTTAGKSLPHSFYDSVLKVLFSKYSVAHTYLQTTTSHSIQQFAESIRTEENNKDSNYLLLFLSGDTSIFEFVNFFYFGLPNTDSPPNVTILPFPHGTGNALCSSLNYFNDLLSLKALFSGQKTHLPLYSLKANTLLTPINPVLSKFSLNPSILFLVVASWCLHSTLVYESDKPALRSKYGSERFRMAAEKILEENPVFKGLLTNSRGNSLNYTDKGWSFSASKEFQDLSYFLLAAVSKFEKSFQISPHSVTEKDQLHLLAIPYTSPEQTMSLMNDAYNRGRHIQNSLVYYGALDSSLTLEISNEMGKSLSIICLDGSSWLVTGPSRKILFSVFPQSFLHFLK